jgi:phosphatidylserine/phosphatidylglycerophosphate/cardiolipin synthase-like enzyme
MAAVAYVSSDAIVAFGAGDTLITDATDDAISAGQTRASVLDEAFRRGATLYSCPDLHAKVLVFRGTAVIGSCNLSASSANTLTEAAWVTTGATAVTASRTFITGLISHSHLIDRAFLDRILQIPVRPRARMLKRRPPAAQPEIILVFFKQALRGDLLKYRRRSAAAQTGGGARDLRVSPADVYRPSLQQILPHPGPRLDVTQGQVQWTPAAGGIDHSTVELWPPTRQRSLELRFARWWTVPAWNITDALFRSESAAGHRLFYVLELDAQGIAWARVLREADLNSENQAVANHIRHRIHQTPARNAVTGLVDLSTGRTLPA